MKLFTRTQAAAAIALTGLAVTAIPASAAAPTVRDIDAEIENNRLQLSVETRGATKVTFKIAGRTIAGRLTETDDDGSRDYERTVSANGMKGGRRAITVKACGSAGCTTKTVTVYVDQDDD